MATVPPAGAAAHGERRCRADDRRKCRCPGRGPRAAGARVPVRAGHTATGAAAAAGERARARPGGGAGAAGEADAGRQAGHQPEAARQFRAREGPHQALNRPWHQPTSINDTQPTPHRGSCSRPGGSMRLLYRGHGLPFVGSRSSRAAESGRRVGACVRGCRSSRSASYGDAVTCGFFGCLTLLHRDLSQLPLHFLAVNRGDVRSVGR